MQLSKNTMVWAGRVVSVLIALPFIFSFIMKLKGGPEVIQGVAHLGWPESMIVPLGILEAACVILYLIPPISILGGILLTGYLGGAISTHIRLGEPVYLHIVFGVLIWAGLYLRDSKLREILPIRFHVLKSGQKR